MTGGDCRPFENQIFYQILNTKYFLHQDYVYTVLDLERKIMVRNVPKHEILKTI